MANPVRHGERLSYVVLAPQTCIDPNQTEIESALNAAGWHRWDGNGDPDIAVLHGTASKGDHFEAGVWSGRGVMLFYLGGKGSRLTGRKQIVGRFGGWASSGDNGRAKVENLLGAIGRWIVATNV
jgi:hypothetical protein